MHRINIAHTVATTSKMPFKKSMLFMLLFTVATVAGLTSLDNAESAETVKEVEDNKLFAEKLQRLELQWQRDRQYFHDEIARLNSACHPDRTVVEEEQRFTDGSANYDSDVTDDRRLHSRSDDISATEIVVDQMSQRLDALGAEVEALKTVNSQQDVAIHEAATSTFVRWGSSQCPSTAELVYSGFVGGSHVYNSAGSSTSVLCLPLNPVLLTRSLPPHIAELGASEYQTYNVFDQHHNRDPVCAVCRTRRPTTVMLPATNVCEDGWTLEYSGYLMGSSTQYAAGHQSVCMDSSLEENAGSAANTNAVLFYFTFTQCSSTGLPCPPYEDRRLVTCCVCSK